MEDRVTKTDEVYAQVIHRLREQADQTGSELTTYDVVRHTEEAIRDHNRFNRAWRVQAYMALIALSALFWAGIVALAKLVIRTLVS